MMILLEKDYVNSVDLLGVYGYRECGSWMKEDLRFGLSSPKVRLLATAKPEENAEQKIPQERGEFLLICSLQALLY